ncbi:hypothetical protein [Bremerella cremea]|uniref:hypothetical protein n=1 Tax=Bremerella cremea TaxID=1031537 RepID=UPI0031E90AC2
MTTTCTAVVIDRALIVEAETMTTGANIHNVKSLLFGYRLAIELIQEGKDLDGSLTAKLPQYAGDLRRALAAPRHAR